jgi:uncharacterized protein involved in exopolysaccharide biosynthesis
MTEADMNTPRERGPGHQGDQPAVPQKGDRREAPARTQEETLAQLRLELARMPRGVDDVVDWVGFVRRQWLVMFTVAFLVMAVCVGLLYIWPRQYASNAQFLVKNARQDLMIGPNDNAGAVYRDNVSEEVLNTELQLMRSRDILSAVVKDLGLDKGLIEKGRPPAMATEMAVQGLWNQVNVTALRKTSVVEIAYLNGDPQLAKDVVQQIADRYLAAHLVMHSSPGTYELFKKQAAEASVELRKAEEDVAALARSSNLVILDTQKQDALKSVQEIDAQLNSLNAEMREQETRARIAELHMSRTPQRVPTARRNIPNQSSVERLYTLRVELLNKRTEALTKFQPTDRMVVELDKQIEDTGAALEKAQNISANEETTDINPGWQALEAERTKARLAYAGLESKAAQLKKELEEQRSRTLLITEAGPRYEELTRKVTEARSRYELYAKKEEEARIAEVLDRQRISNVVLAQAPVVSHVPASPNVRLGLVAGAIAAAFAGIGTGFLREVLGSQFSRRRSASSGMAVLGINPATAELP